MERFLSELAVRGRVAASTQNQPLNALVFLYGQVLHQELGRIGEGEAAGAVAGGADARGGGAGPPGHPKHNSQVVEL